MRQRLKRWLFRLLGKEVQYIIENSEAAALIVRAIAIDAKVASYHANLGLVLADLLELTVNQIGLKQGVDALAAQVHRRRDRPDLLAVPRQEQRRLDAVHLAFAGQAGRQGLARADAGTRCARRRRELAPDSSEPPSTLFACR